MKLRKLRIVWSVGWGVVAMLLCVLWVWGFSEFKTIRCGSFDNKEFAIWIFSSNIGLAVTDFGPGPEHNGSFSGHLLFVQPFRRLIVFAGLLSAMPWVCYRFSKKLRQPMRYRKLRIAWSVAWGLLAVLLCFLWPPPPRYPFPNFGGGLDIPFRQDGFHWPTRDELITGQWGPVWPFLWNHVRYFLPISLVLSAAPWLHYRFSLRTLLIATTLVAAALGLLVRS